MRVGRAALGLALTLLAACSPGEQATQGSMTAPTVAQALPWDAVAPDAYDTLIGAGFRLDRFMSQWGGFGSDGRHRPELSEVQQEHLSRELTTEERSQLESLFDHHEEGIRQAATAAYDNLRIALDETWVAGNFHREAADDAGAFALDAQAAFDEVSELGGYTYCDAFTTGGWQVRVVVSSPEHPTFHVAFRELRMAVRAREADAQAFLAGLG